MIGSKTYTFRIGIRDLDIIGPIATPLGGNHACILLDKDIFEYGTQKTKKIKKYERHKNVGKVGSFDWDYLGQTLNGLTYISPDELENLIKKDGNWGPGKYNFFSHNCHDFVIFCLQKIGFPESNLTKFICLKRISPGKVQIKSSYYYDDYSFDIRGAKMENGTEIILYQSHGRKNQTFNMEYNSDNTVTFKNGDFAITVKDGEATSGAKIQISECNDTAAQKFYLINSEYGGCNIHSAINPYYAITTCDEEDKNKKMKKINLSYFSQFSSNQRFKLIYK